MDTDLQLERLSDRDLIQRLLGSDAAAACAETHAAYGLATLDALSTSDPLALQHLMGLPAEAALRLAAAVELHRRLLRTRQPSAALQAPEAIVQVMLPLLVRDHECLWCLCLDPRLRLVGEPIQVTQGDIDGVDAGPRAFFRNALRRGACSAIAVHNHPTGDPTPSAADAAVTRRLVTAGSAVDVRLADHIVVCADGRFTSLRRDQPELFR